MPLWYLAAAGFLETVEGDVVHYAHIEARIEQRGERFDIHEIAFDRWGTVKTSQDLEGMGSTVLSFGQGQRVVGVRQAWATGALRSL